MIVDASARCSGDGFVPRGGPWQAHAREAAGGPISTFSVFWIGASTFSGTMVNGMVWLKRVGLAAAPGPSLTSAPMTAKPSSASWAKNASFVARFNSSRVQLASSAGRLPRKRWRHAAAGAALAMAQAAGGTPRHAEARRATGARRREGSNAG